MPLKRFSCAHPNFSLVLVNYLGNLSICTHFKKLHSSSSIFSLLHLLAFAPHFSPFASSPAPHSASSVFILFRLSAYHLNLPTFTFIRLQFAFTCFHSPSSFICLHLPSSVFICLYLFSFAFLCPHSASSVFVRLYPSSRTFTRPHTHSSAFIRLHLSQVCHHLPLFAFICLSSPSSVFILLPIRLHLPSYVFLHIHPS